MKTIARTLLLILAAAPPAAAFTLVMLALPGFDGGGAGIRANPLIALGDIVLNTFSIVLSAALLAWFLAIVAVIASFAFQASSRFSSFVQFSIDFGSAFPRLLWGVAGAGVFGGLCGLGISASTGVLTLGCLLAPIVATTLHDGISIQARHFMPSCQALGLNRWQAFRFCILKAAAPSSWAALRLCLARGVGDAAALFLTAGSGFTLIKSAFDPGATLSVYVLVLILETPGQQYTAYAAAALLFALSASIQFALNGAPLFSKFNNTHARKENA